LPARWGYIIDRDFGDMSYLVEYPKITSKFGDKHVMPVQERQRLLKQGFTPRSKAPEAEELRIPEPRYPDASAHWSCYADKDWWFPLISAREAELAEWRFTGNKKKIVDLLSRTQEGSYVLYGRNGLGEALLEALTPHGEYDEDEDNYESARVLLRSLRNMVNWGLVYVFEGKSHPEEAPDFLIQSAPILDEYIEMQEKRFGTTHKEEAPDVERHATFNLKRHTAAAAELYSQRRSGADLFHSEVFDGTAQQPTVIVNRGSFRYGRGHVAAVQYWEYVSDIETVSPLDEYLNRDFLRDLQVSSVLDQIKEAPVAKEAADVSYSVLMLTEDDLFMVFEYVKKYLTRGNLEELSELQFKKSLSPEDSVKEALVRLPKNKTVHVLRQIRLLSAEIIKAVTDSRVASISLAVELAPDPRESDEPF